MRIECVCACCLSFIRLLNLTHAFSTHLTTSRINMCMFLLFQQFDAICKAEVAFFITRAFINVSDKFTKFFSACVCIFFQAHAILSFSFGFFLSILLCLFYFGVCRMFVVVEFIHWICLHLFFRKHLLKSRIESATVCSFLLAEHATQISVLEWDRFRF